MDWELIQKILSYASGPIVGAIIGLFTNYLAVKMLFRPYYPKYIGKFRIPFTPGIIPKRQKNLAHAIGIAVGENLFTKEDMKNMLCSENVKKKVSSTITDKLLSNTDMTPDTILVMLSDEVYAQKFHESTASFLSNKIIESAKNADIAEIIAIKGKETVKEKKSSMGILGAFITDGVIDSFINEIKNHLNEFIDEHAEEKLTPVIEREIDGFFGKPLNKQFDFEKVNRESIESKIGVLYDAAVDQGISFTLKEFDISAIVEEKVNAMDVKDLEKLCLSVMKKELRAIIYLGALIGLIIGTVNIFI